MRRCFVLPTILLFVWFCPNAVYAQQNCPAGVLYSTLIGDGLAEDGAGIAVDDFGRAYIGGTTFSFDFPTSRQRTEQSKHGVDVVSFQLDAGGTATSAVQWINPAGENDEDHGYAIGLDESGNVYVAGETRSADFCAATNPAANGYDTTYNGNTDGFVYKQTADGTIAWCTYIGGTELDVIRDLLVHSDGRVTVTGGTWSTDFSGAVNGLSGLRDLFVLQLATDGSTLNFSKILGGSGQEEGLGVAEDSAGNIFVTGWAFSADIPLATNLHNGSTDAFLGKLDAAGVWQSFEYIGGTGEDRGYALAVDSSDRIVVAGRTGSDDYPTTSDGFDTTFNETSFNYDGFITVLDSNREMAWSSYVGGVGTDSVDAVLVDGRDVWLTGGSRAADFPTTDGSMLNGDEDVFLVQMNIDDGALKSSRLFGGNDTEQGSDLAMLFDDVYIVGQTRSADFCTTASAYDSSHNGDYDMFVMRLQVQQAIPTAVSIATTQSTLPLYTIYLLLAFNVIATLLLNQVKRGD